MAKKTLSRAPDAAPAPSRPSSPPKTPAPTAARPSGHPRARGASKPAVPVPPAPRPEARPAATSSARERGGRPHQADSAPAARVDRLAAPSTATAPTRPVRHKVKATKMGYIYHERRRVGDVFMVHGKDFNPSWMTIVDGSTPLRKTTGKQELRRLHDEILSAKRAERLTADEHPEIPTGTENPLGAEE